MATIRKSITFTDTLNNWVQSLIAAGEYTNESEYIRDLVRQDRDKKSELIALRRAIDKGLNSGVSDKTFEQVILETKAEMKADGRI